MTRQPAYEPCRLRSTSGRNLDPAPPSGFLCSVLELKSVSVAPGGISETGRDDGTPDVGRDPRARLNLRLKRFGVRCPCSDRSAPVMPSLRSTLRASSRSWGVAWRIRPIFSVLRMRERRLRRVISWFAVSASGGGSVYLVSRDGSWISCSASFDVVGWRSIRLQHISLWSLYR